MGEKILEYQVIPKIWGADDGSVPAPGEMFLFFDGGMPMMVDLRCPCGCEMTCPTHLAEPGKKQPGDRHWVLSLDEQNRPTLTPSIRWVNGCKAHFNVTAGRTIFHDDSGK